MRYCLPTGVVCISSHLHPNVSCFFYGFPNGNEKSFCWKNERLGTWVRSAMAWDDWKSNMVTCLPYHWKASSNPPTTAWLALPNIFTAKACKIFLCKIYLDRIFLGKIFLCKTFLRKICCALPSISNCLTTAPAQREAAVSISLISVTKEARCAPPHWFHNVSNLNIGPKVSR